MIYNDAAEQALINSALVHGDKPDILPSAFYKQTHRWIWEAILQVDVPDLVTVTAQLRKNGHQIDNEVTRIALQESDFWNADKYARQIKDAATRRWLVDGAGKVVRDAHDETKDINNIINIHHAHTLLHGGCPLILGFFLPKENRFKLKHSGQSQQHRRIRWDQG